MLKFIGTGSAFNTKLGNNGAYVKSDDQKTLFLIDCGEVTFSRLQKYGVLDGVERVHVLMTHNHPDHIGSLGSLAFFMFYKSFPFESRITLYSPDIVELMQNLTSTGVREEHYLIQELFEASNTISLGSSIGILLARPMIVPHDKRLTSYAYYLQFEKDTYKTIYYSGDSKEIPRSVQLDIDTNKISAMYQDTSTHDYEDNVHLSLKKLIEKIPESFRKNVWCMHLDKDFNSDEVKSLGFNVAECRFNRDLFITNDNSDYNLASDVDDGERP